jgi:hypothetical protein
MKLVPVCEWSNCCRTEEIQIAHMSNQTLKQHRLLLITKKIKNKTSYRWQQIPNSQSRQYLPIETKISQAPTLNQLSTRKRGKKEEDIHPEKSYDMHFHQLTPTSPCSFKPMSVLDLHGWDWGTCKSWPKHIVKQASSLAALFVLSSWAAAWTAIWEWTERRLLQDTSGGRPQLRVAIPPFSQEVKSWWVLAGFHRVCGVGQDLT